MKTFCLTASRCRKITKVPFWCFKKFLVFLKFSDAAYLPGAKVLLKHEGTMSKSCCLQENFPPLFGKISGNEKFYGQTGGYDDFSVQFFLSQYRFFFRRGTLLRFRRILVSENFMDKRAGGREYHNFPLKLFCLTVHFVEEHFCVSESFRYRKILWIRVEYHDCLSKICCFTVPKNFVGESFNFSEIWGAKKFMHKKGISLFSVEIFLSRSAEKVFSFKKIP